ncbi:hypothetical protein [Methanobacterium alcaliphilum]|uniref:DNA replication complex subunit Gins51 n=1 Tax=Methanobacterium alcaliphilum TaxID=392018 RepID=UPI002009E322|nr:hypothetical protein [Methanobacterium alcaliphilum]MCK9151008.1 hypothetical protein [Methanobacterium alcaliphilum]
MDEFFQKLRKIQKKERNESGLARVGDDFYKRVHRYIEELMDTVGNDPFAKEQYLLRDTQRIATEICERREHKITDSAVMNIQRSYHLFKGKPKFDLQDTTPLNLTPEEEQLYFSLIDTLRGYRSKIIPSLDALDDEVIIEKPNIPKKKDNSKKGLTDEERALFELKQLEQSNISPNTEFNDVVPLNSENSKKYVPINPEDIKKISESKKDEDAKLTKNLKTLVIFEQLPSIVGVDEKVYGPFHPQDVVIMPESNANIFIKSRKGRLVHK